MDLLDLKTEFTQDPSNLGYGQATTQGKVELINAVSPVIAIAQRVATGNILRYLAQAPFRLPALPVEIQAAWKTELSLILGISDFDVSDVSFQTMLSLGESQGVITTPEVTAITALGTRPGSRAEQLWGASTLVSLNDAASVM
jgi:hypothetical protein